jgi:hypothetical protein
MRGEDYEKPLKLLALKMASTGTSADGRWARAFCG